MGAKSENRMDRWLWDFLDQSAAPYQRRLNEPEENKNQNAGDRTKCPNYALTNGSALPETLGSAEAAETRSADRPEIRQTLLQSQYGSEEVALFFHALKDCITVED
jgi:hypothetical protein